MSKRRNTVGKIFFGLAICTPFAMVLIRANVVSGQGPAEAAASWLIAVFGLIVIACFALTALVIGWHVKFIRYSVLGLVCLIALAFPLSIILDAYGNRLAAKRHDLRMQDQQLIDRLVEEFEPQFVAHRTEPEKVLSLIASLDEKVNSSCRLERGCLSAYEYENLKTDAFLHLGIFTDPKFFEMVPDQSGYSQRYTSFYERHAAAFSEEYQFTRLFKVMHLHTYDPDERSSTGLNGHDQAMFAEILAENEYADAFRHFLPLSSSNFWYDARGPVAVVKAALHFENTLGATELVTESIAHTTYHYAGSYAQCELEKFDLTFRTLKGSDNLDDHIEQLFEQMPVQCTARKWDTWYDFDEDLFCYLHKNPTWVGLYTSENKLRSITNDNINCAAPQ